MTAHPVRLVLTDDLRRSRLTVFFRLLLAVPHAVWAVLAGIAVAAAVLVNWFVLLVRGQTPLALHRFVAGYVRYLIQIGAFVLLAANPFPAFFPVGDRRYPIDVEIAPPETRNAGSASNSRNPVVQRLCRSAGTSSTSTG